MNRLPSYRKTFNRINQLKRQIQKFNPEKYETNNNDLLICYQQEMEASEDSQGKTENLLSTGCVSTTP